MIRENFKKWNQITVGDSLTFPVNQQRHQVHAEPRQALASWHMEYFWMTGNVFGNQFFYVWFTPRSWSRNSPMRTTKRTRISSTSNRVGDSFRKRWQTKWRHNSNADLCRKAVDYEFSDTGGVSAKFYGWTAKTANFGVAIRLIPWSTIFFDLENTIQISIDCLFWSIRRQCHGSKKWRWLIHWKNWSPRDQFMEGFSQFRDAGREDCWTRSSRIPNSRRMSVSRKRKPRRRTGFYEEDRSPSWSGTSFEWLALMIQYWILRICSLSLFMMIVFRNSIQDGTKFYCQCQRCHPMISWKVCTNWEYESLRNSRLYWNCTTWRFIRRYRCPINEKWRRWWRGVQIRNFDYEILTPGTGEMKQEPW